LYSMGSGSLNSLPADLRIPLQVGRQVAGPEHGYMPLDGADADAGGGVDLVALQALDDVFLLNLKLL